MSNILFWGSRNDSNSTRDEQQSRNEQRVGEPLNEDPMQNNENNELIERIRQLEEENLFIKSEQDKRFSDMDKKLHQLQELTDKLRQGSKKSAQIAESESDNESVRNAASESNPEAKKEGQETAGSQSVKIAPIETEFLSFKDQLDNIEKILTKELADERQKRIAVSEKLADRQSKYENLMQSVQEDRYRKDKVKLLNKVIFFTDITRRMLYEFNAHRDVSQPKHEETKFLEKQFEKLIETMDEALRSEMVTTRPMAKLGDAFDEDTMEVIDTVETEDLDLVGKVYRSISACYLWQLPYILKARLDEKGDEIKHYRFVLHPEEVIIYNLKK